MDGSKKRRIYGAAAVSATAIATLLGAQPAAAARPDTPPPGLVRSCDGTGPDEGRAWPVKWQGSTRCPSPEDGSYKWWLKVE